ncbi:MAG: serine/threonine-protein kinase [Myxococcota bacterium]
MTTAPLAEDLRRDGQPGLSWSTVAPLAAAICELLESHGGAPLHLDELWTEGRGVRWVPGEVSPDRSVYAAPEWEDGPQDVPARIYNAAALIAHLLRGQVLFSADSPAALRVRKLLETPPPMPATVPPPVAAALNAALSTEPSGRPPSLSALRDVLQAPPVPQYGAPSPGLPAAAPPEARSGSQGVRLALAGAVALFSILGAVVIVGGLMTSLSAPLEAPPRVADAPEEATLDTTAPANGAVAIEEEAAADPAPLMADEKAGEEAAAPAMAAEPEPEIAIGEDAGASDSRTKPRTGRSSVRPAPTRHEPASSGTAKREQAGAADTADAWIEQKSSSDPAFGFAEEPPPPPPLPESGSARSNTTLWIVAAGLGGLTCLGGGTLVSFAALGVGVSALRRRRRASTPALPEPQAAQRSMPTLDVGLDFTPVDSRLKAKNTATPPPWNAQATFRPFLLGGYRCLSKLGEGGMGVVYVAEHVQLQRKCAVKVLSPAVRREKMLTLFRREARLAAQINHPNVVTIYDFGESKGALFYLAMEFIDGVPLDEIDLPLSPRRALDITRQLCEGLDAAHEAGIIHRDLKPANILLSTDRQGRDLVKILDFGIARPIASDGSTVMGEGVILGTPDWMSPEQARGEPHLDARSDVFSAALIVYALLTGRQAYTGGHTPLQVVIRRSAVSQPPPPPSQVRPGLPPQVDGAILRALSPDRNARPSSAMAFYADLI